MLRDLSRFLQHSRISYVSFTALISVVLLCLLIFPSVTFCATWEPIGPDGGTFIFSMTNPANANEVTAITTSPSPSNVYRSNDAGATWSTIGEIPYPYIYDVSAFNFSTLYAIRSSRCYRSTDGGISWSEGRLPTSSGSARSVCAHPTNSRIVYAGGLYSDYINNTRTYYMVFFKSTDGGMSWTASQFFAFGYFYPYDMAISKSNPSVMYISGYKEVGNQYFGALLKTSDGGNTWTDISSDVDTERYLLFTSVVIDPTDEGKVYVGGDYFYRGTKTGRDPDLSWTRSRTPYYIYSLGIDPVDPSRIYMGMYESLAASTNYGVTWNVRNNSVKHVAEHIAVAPADSSQVYVSSYAGFYKSSDFGDNWATSHEGIYAGRINAMAVDPRMILVQNNGYLMSFGRGRNVVWEDVVTPPSCGEVCDILINPENPNTVLILEGYG
jgi:photosystem II stability/assembly factor-like uncharacterized protein